MRALIVADGDIPNRASIDAAWPGWDRDVELIVAADGGWDRAAALGLKPALLVGDADSLPEGRFAEVAAAGVPVERSPAAKDESDAELALLAALRRGATHVTILGAMGGRRFDHALANVGLLSLPDRPEARVELLDATTRVRLIRAPAVDGGDGPAGGAAGNPAGVAGARLELPGAVGDLVSLLPLGAPAEGVTTVGLLYPLVNETLRAGPARGLSNVRVQAEASVSISRGSLLVVETRPGGAEQVGNKTGQLGTGDLM
jgi:thiamine pyrophosphokinase